MTRVLEFVLNGAATHVEIEDSDRLLDVLRERLALRGTKEGCAEGRCGACTVVMDGLPVTACLVLGVQARGSRVDTIEGVDPSRLGALLRAGATQCGACTPGVVQTALWIADHPDLVATEGIRQLLSGHLCRCTGYGGIVEGVEDTIRGAADSGAADMTAETD